MFPFWRTYDKRCSLERNIMRQSDVPFFGTERAEKHKRSLGSENFG